MKKIFIFALFTFGAFVKIDCATGVCNDINAIWTDTDNNNCQRTCQNPTSCDDCDDERKSGCICGDGYWKNSYGKCVLPEECDCCKGDPKKVWDPCGNVCPLTCDNMNENRLCLAVCKNEGECVCRDGYVEDCDGNCIPPCDCPPKIKCGAHEHYGCGPNCDTECHRLSVLNHCVLGCDEKCTKKCYCDDGYARNDKGVCIPIKKCPRENIPTCGPNEHFSCGPACDTECSRLGKPCEIQNIKCTERCYCDDGYARNSFGVCIKIKDCPAASIPQCGSCEHFDCGPLLDRHCRYLDEEPEPSCVKCEERCYCDEGFARDDYGDCIKVEECDNNNWTIDRIRTFADEMRNRIINTRWNDTRSIQSISCGRNRHFGCGPSYDTECRTLRANLQRGGRRDRRYNVRFLRNNQQRQNQNPMDRFNQDRQRDLKNFRNFGNDRLRDFQDIGLRNGQLIDGNPLFGAMRLFDNRDNDMRRRIEETRQQFWQDNEIRQYQLRGPLWGLPFENDNCVPRCYCDDGYARNDKGDVVPISECPAGDIPECGPNEFFNSGPDFDPECRSLNRGFDRRFDRGFDRGFDRRFDRRFDRGFPPSRLYARGIERCYCKEGCARNDNGNCIPVDDCPV